MCVTIVDLKNRALCVCTAALLKNKNNMGNSERAEDVRIINLYNNNNTVPSCNHSVTCAYNIYILYLL